MRDARPKDMDPAEARLAERVHDWLDQAVVPIDAAAIARIATAPRSRATTMTRLGTFSMRLATGIIVLALGAGAVSLLAGQAPWATPGALPSPSASPVPAGIPGPVAFTGRFRLTDCDGEAMIVLAGEPNARGAVCPLLIQEMSDPRLLGIGEVRVDRDTLAGGYALSMAAHRIENAGGAWQELPGLAIERPDGSTPARTITLRGEGGYAGLTAVAELSPAERAWELRGYIIQGEPPMAAASEPPRPDASEPPMQ